MTTLLAVVGPTASGKTELALRLARERHAEIISVDSRQVYRHLSIGTAKPIGVWRDKATYIVEDIPYHLVDIWDPRDAFTAADFVRLVQEILQAVRSRGRETILVGGTGLYLKALVEGLAPLPPRDEALREELRVIAEKQGRPALHARLAAVDAVAAARIPANNIQRVLRALEVFTLTGKPISQWHTEHQTRLPPPYTIEMIGTDWPVDVLAERIAERCDRMLAGGLIEETRALLQKGYPAACPGLTGVGYRQVVAFLEGRLTQDQMLSLMIRDTRHYAKRQRTWFRHQHAVRWLPPT